MNSIDTIALILQAISLEILFGDYNNKDLMQELQHQDVNYFQRILKNQEEMLSILRKENTDG